MSTIQIALRIPSALLIEAKALAEQEDRRLASMLIILIKRGVANTTMDGLAQKQVATAKRAQS